MSVNIRASEQKIVFAESGIFVRFRAAIARSFSRRLALMPLP
jgi:hypothetical protein